MTNEEAKVFLLQLHTDKQLNKSEHEALRVAIKALTTPPNDNWEGYSKRLWKSAYERGKAEAEHVNALGKIREIRDKIIAEVDYEDEYDDQDIAKGLYKAVEIIDKCMAESEDKE